MDPNVCRICLNTSDEYISLAENETLINKICSICASVQVNLDEDLPKRICRKCCIKLDDAYNLRLQIEKSDSLLREIAKRNNDSKPVCQRKKLRVRKLKKEKVETVKCEEPPDLCQVKSECDEDEAVSDREWDEGNKSERANKKNVASSLMGMCEICGKLLYHKYIERHKESHTESFTYTCNVCSKKFKTKSGLKVHRDRHETNPKKFYCEVCGQEFGYAMTLRKHATIHTGERPFECTVCRRRFREKRRLNQHMRMHSGEAPYACAFCSRKFALKWNLTQHTRLHTAETPYKCLYCNAAYRHNVSLKTHLTKVHQHVEEKKVETDGLLVTSFAKFRHVTC